jgi:hypothetical protein
MALTKTELDEANHRANAQRLAGPVARAVRYDGRRKKLIVNLKKGVDLVFDPSMVQGLEKGSQAGLKEVEITPSGLGLHFPLLDADVYLPALIEGISGSPSWMAAQMGKRGGSIKSQAKAQAARENGKLGGRPAKRAAR